MGTVDLEKLADSRERAGAFVLWLSYEGQMDVWEPFSDKSYLSAIFDRQGLLVAAPIDLGTKKAESFSLQLLQGFWFQLKKKNPKIDEGFTTAGSSSGKAIGSWITIG